MQKIDHDTMVLVLADPRISGLVAMECNGVPNAAQNRLVAKLAPMHRDIVKP